MGGRHPGRSRGIEQARRFRRGDKIARLGPAGSGPKSRDHLVHDEDHAVPGAFWKVVIVKPKGEPLKVAAFIMNQTATTSDNFVVSQTTIKEIQDRTGFVLFPRLLAALVDSKDEEWVATMEELE